MRSIIYAAVAFTVSTVFSMVAIAGEGVTPPSPLPYEPTVEWVWEDNCPIYHVMEDETSPRSAVAFNQPTCRAVASTQIVKRDVAGALRRIMREADSRCLYGKFRSPEEFYFSIQKPSVGGIEAREGTQYAVINDCTPNFLDRPYEVGSR